MLTIVVPGVELFDESENRFVSDEGSVTLELEHSLVSLSKWESIHETPFLNVEKKTTEQVYSYVRCMLLNPEVPEEVFTRLDKENLDKITTYMDAKMTATWFSDMPGAPKSREVITSELIYYWMIVFEIPFECQYWHLNRLFTLIRVCNLKAGKPQKMSRGEIAQRQRELNARRRKQLGTKG